MSLYAFCRLFASHFMAAAWARMGATHRGILSQKQVSGPGCIWRCTSHPFTFQHARWKEDYSLISTLFVPYEEGTRVASDITASKGKGRPARSALDAYVGPPWPEAAVLCPACVLGKHQGGQISKLNKSSPNPPGLLGSYLPEQFEINPPCLEAAYLTVPDSQPRSTFFTHSFHSFLNGFFLLLLFEQLQRPELRLRARGTWRSQNWQQGFQKVRQSGAGLRRAARSPKGQKEGERERERETEKATLLLPGEASHAPSLPSPRLGGSPPPPRATGSRPRGGPSVPPSPDAGPPGQAGRQAGGRH